MGRYTLLRGLAIGGMAELYLARATGARATRAEDGLVVLKRILPHYAAQASFVAMFLDEARLTAGLRHPNITQVHDIGQCDLGLFFTMEFVHGVDVRKLLRTASLRGEYIPLEHVVAIVCGAASGLHVAHEKTGPDGEPLGIVHRDVSPANLLVSYQGDIKLIDFGVAKATRRQAETRAGCVKGKLAYMSPEQCLGEPLDRRSDVFALGILLFELTTNRRLFWDENDFAIMKRIARGNVPRPRHLRRDLPVELEEIILRALRHRPAHRYATADELKLALERFARRHRLAMSRARLGSYTRDLFADALVAWEAQRAELAVMPAPIEPAAPIAPVAPAETVPVVRDVATPPPPPRAPMRPTRPIRPIPDRSDPLADSIAAVMTGRRGGVAPPARARARPERLRPISGQILVHAPPGGSRAARASTATDRDRGHAGEAKAATAQVRKPALAVGSAPVDAPVVKLDEIVLATLSVDVLELSGQHRPAPSRAATPGARDSGGHPRLGNIPS